MKKLLLILLLAVGAVVMPAQAQTAKAIWCAGNTTLYFTNDSNTYAVGGTYNGQTINNVYSNISTTGYSSGQGIYGLYTTSPWNSIRQLVTSVVIDSNFASHQITSLAWWFYGFNRLTSITGSEYLVTSCVTSLEFTFMSCALTSLDASQWDTSNVTSLEGTFRFSSLTSLDASQWDTSNVTTLWCTFQNCEKLTTLDVSNWDTGNVTDMTHTFSECHSLTALDVSNWNTSNVITLDNTFHACIALTSLDVSNWDTSNVTTLEGTFSDSRLLTSLDVSNWNTSNVTTLGRTFSYCRSLTSLDVSKWDTSNVTSLYGTFQVCESLTSLDVSKWDTSNVTTLGYTFSNCRLLTSLTFGKNFCADKVTTTAYMFQHCYNLRYLDFYASDDTDAITSVQRSQKDPMFDNVPATTVIYLPHGSQNLTDAQNVVYSYNGDENDLRCPVYYSEDMKDIELPHDFTTNKARYTRSMSKNYGTVILPYEFTSNGDVQAYTLDEEKPGIMYFKDTQTVPAHTPFAFRMSHDFTVEDESENGPSADFTMVDKSGNFGITVHATRSTNAAENTWTGTKGSPYTAGTNLGGWTTKGYYVAETVSDYSDAYYIANEKFYKADGALKMFPHRVTFHGAWTKGTGNAKFFDIETGDDEMVTAIEAAETEQTLCEAAGIYDASGRRQTTVRKGLNIVRMSDGTVKKVIIK